MVVAALAEPAVIKHEELDATFHGLLGDLNQPILGEIEIGGLPVVNQDRTLPVTPDAPGEAGLVKLVEVLAHAVQAFIRVDHNRFGSLERLLWFELPVEPGWVDAEQHTGDIVGVDFGLCQKVAAVDMAETDSLP